MRIRLLSCVLVGALGFGLACKRAAPTAPVSTAPAPLAQQYCWWTSLRTSLSAGLRRSALRSNLHHVRIRAAVVGVLRDTTVYDEATRTTEQVATVVRVYAPRSVLPRDSASRTTPALHSEGLVLAWVRADTTRVRYYLAHDRELSGGETIGRCTTLWRAAMGVAPAPP